MSIDATRVLGGDSTHRGLLGVGGNGLRVVLVAGSLILGFVFAPALEFWSIGAGILLAALAFLLTQKTRRGSLLERARKRRRWRERVTRGTDAYLPYSAELWAAAEHTASQARGRTAKRDAAQGLSALRVMPDGADGLGWLQAGWRQPGIAWQVPIGEDARLTVAFEVPGQLRGLQTEAKVNENSVAFGRFLAGRAGGSLVTKIQTLTRVLPTDSTLYEQWVAGQQDEASPAALRESYAEALHRTAAGSMTQRHFLVATWPLTAEFDSQARRYGEGRDGWRGLMTDEIADVVRDLEAAGYTGARAMSARQTSAVMLHQQNPSRPIDFVGDADPVRFGLPSRDEWSASVTQGIDYTTGQPAVWWHRTCRVDAEAMAVTQRTPLWHLELFLSRKLRFVRSVSFHIELVDAAEARVRTRQDLTNDQAEQLSAAEKGQVDDGSRGSMKSAAERRARDLVPGSQHHGAYWVGYVTISAPTREDLVTASRSLTRLCASDLAIDHLEWLDTEQAAASGTTWPLGRGLASIVPSVGDRLVRGLAGRAEKEAIS